MYQLTIDQSKAAIKQAIQSNNLQFLQVSLHSASSTGINVNTPLDEQGNACLHYAAAVGATEIAKFLLDNGADMAAANRFGHAPEAIAASKGQTHLASWLKQVRKEKQRSGYANKKTVEKAQIALEELRSANRQLLQNERSLKQEIEGLKKTDYAPLLAQLQERLEQQERKLDAQEKLMAQERLEKLKAEEELAVQGKLLALQAEAIKEQQIEIKRQQNEIKNLQESQTREKNEMQKELKGSLLFLTPDIQEMLLLKKGKMQKKEEAKRQQEAEKKYQELREKQRQEEKRRKKRLPKQAWLIEALLKGDLEGAKREEQAGALLTEPDANGTYSLVAAVYGMDLEAVKYLESRLKAQEASEQWALVDAMKALERIDKAAPRDLKVGASFRDLGAWHCSEQHKCWTKRYDILVAQYSSARSWYITDWDSRAVELLGVGARWASGWRELKLEFANVREQGWPNRAFEKEVSGGLLICPNQEEHHVVVKEIREQLETLRKMVEAKAGKQPGAAFKPV